MRCGIMDQFASCHAAADRVLLVDCRSLEFHLTPIDPSVRLVICNTMVRHQLAGSEYNRRREQCEEGVARLSAALPGIASCAMSPSTTCRHGAALSEVVLRRCRHVVTENDRVLRAAAGAARPAGSTSSVG